MAMADEDGHLQAADNQNNDPIPVRSPTDSAMFTRHGTSGGDFRDDRVVQNGVCEDLAADPLNSMIQHTIPGQPQRTTVLLRTFSVDGHGAMAMH
jgi:hypothetical protein